MPFITPGLNDIPGMYYSGTSNLVQEQPRDIFYNGRDQANFFSPPPAIDGGSGGAFTAGSGGSGNAANAPYTWLLWAGQAVGRETSSGNYATSIIGQTTANYTSGGTSVTTDVNTAAELVRRIGTSGSFNLTGVPTAGGTVATTLVTYTAVNTTTGVITVSNIGVNYTSGSWIQPNDGSQNIITLIADINGVKVVDMYNTTRINAMASQLWTGGGVINVGYMVNYANSDTSLQAYYKAQIRKNVSSAAFSDDFTG